MKPKFISDNENEMEIFSEIKFPSIKDLDNFWKNKKVSKVFEIGEIDSDDKLFFSEILYKTNQGFFIHLNLIGQNDWGMTIYYKVSQENELNIFIKSLLKEIRKWNN